MYIYYRTAAKNHVYIFPRLVSSQAIFHSMSWIERKKTKSVALAVATGYEMWQQGYLQTLIYPTSPSKLNTPVLTSFLVMKFLISIFNSRDCIFSYHWILVKMDHGYIFNQWYWYSCIVWFIQILLASNSGWSVWVPFYMYRKCQHSCVE